MMTEEARYAKQRPKYLHNRRIIIKRDRRRNWGQRYESEWDNPYGTGSHHGYHSFFVTALLGAVLRKVNAELSHWLLARPTKTWQL